MIRRMGRWAAELAGIGVVGFAAWMVYPPLGLAVIGIYVLIVANTGGEE